MKNRPRKWPFFLYTCLMISSWMAFIALTVFPDPQFLKEWNLNRDYIFDESVAPSDIRKIQLQCPIDRLWPTHPGQTAKEYHHALWAHYDHGKLPVDSYACNVMNPTRKFCLQSTYANAVFLSDLFEDECGNYYRAIQLDTFLKKDESMGTLVSKGRTVYPRPHSPYENDFETGDTYPVKVTDFLFLSPVSPVERTLISAEQASARKEGFQRIRFQWRKSP